MSPEMKRLCEAAEAAGEQWNGWESYMAPSIVRAVLAALKEPGEAALDALNGYACCAGYVPEGWAAAIDSILAEHP